MAYQESPLSLSLLRRKPIHKVKEQNVQIPRSNSCSHSSKNVFKKSEFNQIMLHGFSTAFYFWVFYHSYQVLSQGRQILDPEGRVPSYGGGFKYLTHINQWFQMIFFTLQFLTDLLPRSITKHVKHYLGLFFSMAVFPTTFTVAISFWVIYTIDRKLVYPEVFDLVVPQYLNHFWHTAIILWVLLEIYFCEHSFPSNGTAAVVNFFLNMAYISWTVWIFIKTDFWVYGILEVLPPPLLALFWAGSMFLNFGYFLIGKTLSSICWHKP